MKRRRPAPPPRSGKSGSPAKSARKPRPKPAVVAVPHDRLFEALRDELGL